MSSSASVSVRENPHCGGVFITHGCPGGDAGVCIH